MGQSSSTHKPKTSQKPNWRPEVLFTEACNASDSDPINIRKRRNSEGLPRQNGPNKKDINKAIKFVKDFLPLYTNQNEANISVGTSVLITLDIDTFSQNKALTDPRVQGEIKRVCSQADKNAMFAKDLFNEQAGNIFKKFSFANQKEELIQAPNKFFKVGSFARSHSTPDMSKYVVEGGHDKYKDTFIENHERAANAFGTPSRTPREGEFENRNSASFHSHNSPEKRDQSKLAGQYQDIIQNSQNYPGWRPAERENNNDLSADLTKKQSISFRIESKDQSKTSEEDLGFRSNNQATQAPQTLARGVNLPDVLQVKPEAQENILIQNNYKEKANYAEPPTQTHQYVNPGLGSPSKYPKKILAQNQVQDQDHNLNRNFQPEDKESYSNAKNISQQQIRKDVNKPQIVSQKYASKQWPSLSPVADRRDRSKENSQTEKYQLKKQSKISSDKTSAKMGSQYEGPVAQKRETYMTQSTSQRKKADPLRQSNLVQGNQGYKTNKVERSPLSLKQVRSQGRYDLNVVERNNYQPQVTKSPNKIESTPQQTTPRTNKWFADTQKTQAGNSSPHFNVEVNPINVDLNLDELLKVADRNGGYAQQNVAPGVYANYNDGFSANYNGHFARFQEPPNFAAQYISPKQLDETAYYEENSQFDRKNNSFFQSRHEISQDLNDHSMDHLNNSQLNNSYVRRKKYGNAPQPEVLNYRIANNQNYEFH